MSYVKQPNSIPRLCGNCRFSKENSFKSKRCIECYNEGKGKTGFQQKTSYRINNSDFTRGTGEKYVNRKSKRPVPA